VHVLLGAKISYYKNMLDKLSADRTKTVRKININYVRLNSRSWMLHHSVIIRLIIVILFVHTFLLFFELQSVNAIMLLI